MWKMIVRFLDSLPVAPCSWTTAYEQKSGKDGRVSGSSHWPGSPRPADVLEAGTSLNVRLRI